MRTTVISGEEAAVLGTRYVGGTSSTCVAFSYAATSEARAHDAAAAHSNSNSHHHHHEDDDDFVNVSSTGPGGDAEGGLYGIVASATAVGGTGQSTSAVSLTYFNMCATASGDDDGGIAVIPMPGKVTALCGLVGSAADCALRVRTADAIRRGGGGSDVPSLPQFLASTSNGTVTLIGSIDETKSALGGASGGGVASEFDFLDDDDDESEEEEEGMMMANASSPSNIKNGGNTGGDLFGYRKLAVVSTGGSGWGASCAAAGGTSASTATNAGSLAVGCRLDSPSFDVVAFTESSLALSQENVTLGDPFRCLGGRGVKQLTAVPHDPNSFIFTAHNTAARIDLRIKSGSSVVQQWRWAPKDELLCTACPGGNNLFLTCGTRDGLVVFFDSRGSLSSSSVASPGSVPAAKAPSSYSTLFTPIDALDGDGSTARLDSTSARGGGSSSSSYSSSVVAIHAYDERCFATASADGTISTWVKNDVDASASSATAVQKLTAAAHAETAAIDAKPFSVFTVPGKAGGYGAVGLAGTRRHAAAVTEKGEVVCLRRL